MWAAPAAPAAPAARSSLALAAASGACGAGVVQALAGSWPVSTRLPPAGSGGKESLHQGLASPVSGLTGLEGTGLGEMLGDSAQQWMWSARAVASTPHDLKGDVHRQRLGLARAQA